MDIKKLFCFKRINLEYLQYMISGQYKATVIKILWYFNKDEQLVNK